MNRIKNLNKLFFSLLFFSLFFGILFRSYNLNYDNLWFDEIVSFWVSDPTISFKESFERHQIAEATPFFWNLLLKIFHKLFVYEPSVGRYLSCLIGILSCFSLAYLSRILKKDNSYILTFFLICFNVFLIKYSQELRVYSLIFFLSTINLIFFFRLIESHKTKINILFNLSFFLIFQTLIILTHPFCLIIFFSIILFSCISFLIFKKNYKYLNISIIIITIFNLIYIPIYVKNLNFYSSWITQPELSFYTNFYFSKFFGSRLVGLVHLFLLIYLIAKFRKLFINNFDEKVILLFIIFLSYCLPIIFGYLITPIIWPRYIIYVLIPILIIIPYLIFEIKSKKLKTFLIILIVSSTLGNQWTESNVQQFFNERPFYKSQYTLALKEINKSNYKNFSINLTFAEKQSHKEVFNKALGNYLKKIINNNNLDLKFNEKINKKNLIDEKTWIMCLKNVGGPSCSNLDIAYNFTVVDDKNFNGVNFKLVKILD